MAKPVPPTNADELAARLTLSHEKLTESMQGGHTEQVMAGFADAYRAWLEMEEVFSNSHFRPSGETAGYIGPKGISVPKPLYRRLGFGSLGS